jgi:hypothetical protein
MLSVAKLPQFVAIPKDGMAKSLWQLDIWGWLGAGKAGVFLGSAGILGLFSRDVVVADGLGSTSFSADFTNDRKKNLVGTNVVLPNLAFSVF